MSIPFNPAQVVPGPETHRYNIFGAPGAGKSVWAADIFVNIKKSGRSAELVREKIKKSAYMNRHTSVEERVRFFLQEMEEEIFYLRNHISVISDSPLWLAAFYAALDKNPFYEDIFIHGAKTMDKFFGQGKNILISLPKKENFETIGRYQTYNESVELEGMLEQYLRDNGIEFRKVQAFS